MQRFSRLGGLARHAYVVEADNNNNNNNKQTLLQGLSYLVFEQDVHTNVVHRSDARMYAFMTYRNIKCSSSLEKTISIYQMQQKVAPPKCSENVFTPNKSENSLEKIFGLHLNDTGRKWKWKP